MIIHGNSAQPIPEAADARDFPAIWLRYAQAVDDRFVLRAVDAADRDTKHPVVEPGTVCVGTGNGSVWVRTGAGVWVTVYEPPGAWRTVTLAAGITSGPVLRTRRIGRQVFVEGGVYRTDQAELMNDDIGFLPSDCWPTADKWFATGASSAGPTVQSTARVIVFTSGLVKAYTDQGTGTPSVNMAVSFWAD